MDCPVFDDGDLAAIVRAGVSFSTASLNPNPPALIPECHSSPNLCSDYSCSTSSSMSCSGSLADFATRMKGSCAGAAIRQHGDLGSSTLASQGLRNILNSASFIKPQTGICGTWALHNSNSCTSNSLWARPEGSSLMAAAPCSSPAAIGRGTKRSRKSQQKRIVHVPAPGPVPSRPGAGETVPSDLWAWRKYGQKPIKGSPHPRGYYRCSSSKGCPARKQVERSQTDPTMLVITYTAEHNHSWPSGSSYRVTAPATTTSKSPQSTLSTSAQAQAPKSPLSSNSSCISGGLRLEEEDELTAVASPFSDSEQESADIAVPTSSSTSGCSSTAAAAALDETNMGTGLPAQQSSETISRSCGVTVESEAFLHEALFAEMLEDMHRQNWNWNWNGNLEESNNNIIVAEQSIVDPLDLFNNWSSTSTTNNVALVSKVNVLDIFTS